MLDYLDSVGTTAKRQHDTMYTVWCIASRHGLLFASLESAKVYVLNDALGACCIVAPLYCDD